MSPEILRVQPSEESRNSTVEREGNCDDLGGGGIPFATLNSPNVIPVGLAQACESLLR